REREIFFSEFLAQDEAAIIAACGSSEPLRTFVAESLADLHAPLFAPPDNRRLRVLGIGDCLLNEVRVFLPALCHSAGLPVEMRLIYFSSVQGVGLSHESALKESVEFKADLVSF